MGPKLWLFVVLSMTGTICISKDGKPFASTSSEGDLRVLGQHIPPYAYWKRQIGPPKGPVYRLFHNVYKTCYRKGTQLNLTKPSVGSHDLEFLATDEDVVFPVMKQWQDLIGETETTEDYKYIPVIESPGAVILVAEDETPRYILQEVLTKLWPLALLVFSSAPLAGIIMWIMDHRRNSDDFPKSFLKGGWEGIWWAFVTMTTVGYGDRSPRSIQGRLFGLVWMFVGITLMSIFTATLTTAITADQTETAKIKDSKLGVFQGSREELLAIGEGATVEAETHMATMSDMLKRGQIDGILVDSLYAQYVGKELIGLKEAAFLKSSAFYGILLQHQSLEIQRCFVRQASKQRLQVYRSMTKQFKRRTTKMKIYRRMAEESVDNVCQGMIYLCITCIVGWIVMALSCFAWQWFQQRQIKRKLAPNKVAEPRRIAFVTQTPATECKAKI